jgi:hypothetical protein
MTSPNVERWIHKHRQFLGSRVLEIGSRHYEGRSTSIRDILSVSNPKSSIIGVDIQDGENVDVVIDLTVDDLSPLISKSVNGFDTVICLSVLEHVPSVWKMADNLQRLLQPGGSIFLSVPFVFRIHEYPVDCWRFTPTAIQHLFPEVDFINYEHSEATAADGSARMSLGKGRHTKLNRFVSAGMGNQNKMTRKLEKASGSVTVPYEMRPTMLNFLGTRI